MESNAISNDLAMSMGQMFLFKQCDAAVNEQYPRKRFPNCMTTGLILAPSPNYPPRVIMCVIVQTNPCKSSRPVAGLVNAIRLWFTHVVVSFVGGRTGEGGLGVGLVEGASPSRYLRKRWRFVM